MRVRVGVAVAALLGVALGVGACGSRPGGELVVSGEAPPRLATVHGVVTGGGRPLSGAHVALVRPGGEERHVTTGGDGTYRFGDVAPGRYELLASHESGVTCSQGGCISAKWEERTEVSLARGETRRVDIDAE